MAVQRHSLLLAWRAICGLLIYTCLIEKITAESSQLIQARRAAATCLTHPNSELISSNRLTLLSSSFRSVLLSSCTLMHLAYLGCYHDKFLPAERDLGGMVALEESKMTPEFCESVCGQRHQYKYFGLQYGMECWCGNEMGKYGKQEPEGHDAKSACVTPCSGNKQVMCGGENLNSVYEIKTQYPKPTPHPDGRPLLGLVMIVKDEAHTLPTTLLAIKPWIDVYYILDTGSTDGTQAAIRQTLGPNGEVWEEPFIDYGRSRNRALEIAQTTKNLGGPPIFSLMLSADETIHNGEGLRKFCEEHRDKSGNNEEAYYMTMDVGWRFDSARLSRTDKSWRYQGRVHEYLSGPNGHGAPSQRVPSTYIKFKVTDDARRSQREFIILRILQEEVAEKPHDTRSSFYLARTYNVVGNHTAALHEFERRVSLGGWKEEVYESLYAIAWQKDALKAPWWEVQQAFLDAHAHSNERAEPLYAIASHWYREKQPSLAWIFASHAATLTYPTAASLWVQADVYSWQCWFIMGMTGLDIRQEREGAKALLRALEKRPGDGIMVQQLGKYRQQLGGEVMDSLICEIDPSKCTATSTPQKTPIDLQLAHSETKRLELGEQRIEPPSIPSPYANQLNQPFIPPTSGLTSTTSTNQALLYSLVAFLFLTNLVLLVALKRGRQSLTGCIPGGMLGTDKQV